MKKSSILEARRKFVNPEVQKKVDLAFQIIDRNHEILVEKELKQKDADSVPSTELCSSLYCTSASRLGASRVSFIT